MLGGSTDVNLVMSDLNLEPWRQEGIEPHYQVRVTPEEVGHSTYDARSVNTGDTDREGESECI